MNPNFVRPRPGSLQSLHIDLDDLEDTSDIQDAFAEGLSQELISSQIELADRKGFANAFAASDNGGWLAVGSPYSTVPIESESPFVESSNGNLYMADGAIFQSGEVYIYKNFIQENDITGEREEVWELDQIVRSRHFNVGLTYHPIKREISLSRLTQ